MVFSRPGVTFVGISSEHLHSQTVRARELKFWKKVYLPPSVMCHMSCVTCHVSHVMYHISCVTCHMFFLSFFDKVVKLVSWGSVWQRGYPLSCFVNTGKPANRQKRAIILGASLAKQSESIQCKLVWKSTDLHWPCSRGQCSLTALRVNTIFVALQKWDSSLGSCNSVNEAFLGEMYFFFYR